MNKLNCFKSFCYLVVVGVFLVSCAADQELTSAEPETAKQEVGCADVAGVWTVSSTVLSHTCMAGLQTHHFAVEILQDGCEVQSVRRGREPIAGKVEGKVIRWDGLYFYPLTVNV